MIALVVAASPWPGYAPETIAAPAARAAQMTPPVIGTLQDGRAIVTWIDGNGDVEAALRDAQGHWTAQIIGHTALQVLPNGRGPSFILTHRTSVVRDQLGRTRVLWRSCEGDAPACVPVGARLEADGSWTPLTAPDAIAWPPEPVPHPAGRQPVPYPTAADDAGDVVSVVRADDGTTTIYRLSPAGAWTVQATIPYQPGSGCGVGQPVMDAAGNAAALDLCAQSSVSGGSVSLLVLPASGTAPSSVPIAATLSAPDLARVRLAGGAVGGKVTVGIGSQVSAFSWSPDGRLTADTLALPISPSEPNYPGPTLSGTADGRFALVEDGEVALAGAGPTWDDPAAVEPGVTTVLPAAGAPVALSELGEQAPSAGGFLTTFQSLLGTSFDERAWSIVALGTDVAAPVLVQRAQLNRLPGSGYWRPGSRARALVKHRFRGAPLPTISYQWSRCPVHGRCRVIPGAASGDYTVRRADGRSRLQVKVTAANSAGRVTLTMRTPVIARH